MIDAKAALSAVAKGRTNAPAFRLTLASINAHLLAMDVLFRPVHLPSEDNPSDGASRGHRRRPTTRRVLREPGFSKSGRRLHWSYQQMLRAERFLDGISSCDSSTTSEPSTSTISSGSSASVSTFGADMLNSRLRRFLIRHLCSQLGVSSLLSTSSSSGSPPSSQTGSCTSSSTSPAESSSRRLRLPMESSRARGQSGASTLRPVLRSRPRTSAPACSVKWCV